MIISQKTFLNPISPFVHISQLPAISKNGNIIERFAACLFVSQ